MSNPACPKRPEPCTCWEDNGAKPYPANPLAHWWYEPVEEIKPVGEYPIKLPNCPIRYPR